MKSKEFLTLLESMRRHSWKCIMMLDKAWFYLSPDHESISLSPDEEATQKGTKRKSSPKMMLMVIWKPRRFHVIDIRPKGRKFQAGYYISHIPSPLP
jgi:hypothetical protein